MISEIKKAFSNIMSDSYNLRSLGTNYSKKKPMRSFVRGIWGVPDPKFSTREGGRNRRIKVSNDILFSKVNPYDPKCRIYVFGEDNYKILTDMGFDSVLIDKSPYVFDPIKEEYRHKIEIWKYAQKDFDEIVFLDWDCIPLKQIDKNFWHTMSLGKKIQASIYLYTKEKALWRIMNDPRKISAATFVYMREPNIASDIIKIWEDMEKPWREELALTLYIEKLNGGWKGVEDYRLSGFQPVYHNLYYYYNSEYILNAAIKNNTFFHFGKKIIGSLLATYNKNGIDKLIEKEKEMMNNINDVIIKRNSLIERSNHEEI